MSHCGYLQGVYIMTNERNNWVIVFLTFDYIVINVNTCMAILDNVVHTLCLLY